MIQADVEFWQRMEESFSASVTVADDLSIKYVMDDYDRVYIRMINKRIKEILIAAIKNYFVNINKQSAKKIIDGMEAGDCSIVTKSREEYNLAEFLKTWERFHGEKLLSD